MGKNRTVSKVPEERLHPTNPWLFSLKIGFFAGLIWGMVRWVCYILNFTTVLPGFVAEPFFRSAYLKTGWGMVVGLACYILFSIGAAILYQFTLSRLRGPWPGVLYGFVWWCIIFLAIGPMLGMMKHIRHIGWNTIFTELSVFLLWGVFIGYSIAFEFTDEASREPLKAKLNAK